jgi:hypothetical protein
MGAPCVVVLVPVNVCRAVLRRDLKAADIVADRFGVAVTISVSGVVVI